MFVFPSTGGGAGGDCARLGPAETHLGGGTQQLPRVRAAGGIQVTMATVHSNQATVHSNQSTMHSQRQQCIATGQPCLDTKHSNWGESARKQCIFKFF